MKNSTDRDKTIYLKEKHNKRVRENEIFKDKRKNISQETRTENVNHSANETEIYGGGRGRSGCGR